jgi:hypothetical protein
MPGGRHHFYFVDKPPFVYSFVVALTFVNTSLLLVVAFAAKYFLPKASLNSQPCEALASGGIQYHAPTLLCWYASHDIAIQFILLALSAVILVIFRKRVHYHDAG